LIPTEPSSLQMMNSSQTARNLSSQKTRVLFRNPMTPMTYAPRSFSARACG